MILNSSSPPIFAFTDIELSVLRLIASGSTNLEISLHLGYSKKYVNKLISQMYSKYNCRNRAHLTSFFLNSLFSEFVSSSFSQLHLNL